MANCNFYSYQTATGGSSTGGINPIMPENEKINYVEFPAKNLTTTKEFFTAVFDWSFTDFGPEYTAFKNAGLDGGFFQSDR